MKMLCLVAGLVVGLVVAALPALSLSGAASAREAPRTDQIIKKLQPKQKTRSIRGIKVTGGKKQAHEKPSINLYINFEFNSARLGTDAQITLRNLGRALQDPRLAKFRFLIAGHTDAVGTDAYNQTLSEKRANAVRDYLISIFGIAGSRLVAKGFGETKLLNPAKPRDGANRRVQIVNLGGGS